MKKNVIYILILITIFLSFVTFITFNLLHLSIGYWSREVVISLISGIILLKFIQGTRKKKILLAVGGIVLGLLITFVYSSWAHGVAMYDICYPAIGQRNAQLKERLLRETNGLGPEYMEYLSRSWQQHLECERNLLPFPWGKQAKFSDNPPGSIPKEASSESKSK